MFISYNVPDKQVSIVCSLRGHFVVDNLRGPVRCVCKCLNTNTAIYHWRFQTKSKHKLNRNGNY